MLATEAEAEHHRVVTQAVHAEGGRIAMQILHFGRYAYQPSLVAPSALQAPINPFMPHALSGEEVEQTIEGERASAAKRSPASIPTVALSGGAVDIGAAHAPDGGADVWLVRFDPNIVQVPVARGENGGRTLPHKNVVHELVRLGGWGGAAKHFDLPDTAAGGMKTAILVQSAYTGPILAAAKE